MRVLSQPFLINSGSYLSRSVRRSVAASLAPSGDLRKKAITSGGLTIVIVTTRIVSVAMCSRMAGSWPCPTGFVSLYGCQCRRILTEPAALRGDGWD